MEQNASEQTDYMCGVIEALLFVSEKPVTLEQIKKVLPSFTVSDIKKMIEILQKKYEERSGGLTIVEIAGGYQILTNPKHVSYIHSFYKTKHKDKLSKPALETLAIIAYKQPVTRADIEIIRGVNSDGVVANLIDKELIKAVGRKDVPGKPFLYGTTRQFLEYFGLRSLNDLPKLEEFPGFAEKKDLENVTVEKELSRNLENQENIQESGHCEQQDENNKEEHDIALDAEQDLDNDSVIENHKSDSLNQNEETTEEEIINKSQE